MQNYMKNSENLNETCSSTSSTNTNVSSKTTSSNTSSSKFLSTFKSLFDIFDPESKGYIDLYELELLGANQNEILNEIIRFIRANDKNNRVKESNPKEYLITFDKFVKAADAVMKKRKHSKLNVNGNGNVNVLVPNPNLVNLIANKNKTLSEEFSEPPIQHSANPNKTLPTDPSQQSQTYKLRQAFISSTKNLLANITNEQSTKSNASNKTVELKEKFCLNNANSCDLNKLLEEESILLNNGIKNLERIKGIYEQNLRQNQQKKQEDANKLKHENLFSIDKILINLREISGLNKALDGFVASNNSYDKNPPANDSVSLESNSSFSVEEFNKKLLTNENNLLVNYDEKIKEKQNRIDVLQKEKSALIRRIFEMKSMKNTGTDSARLDRFIKSDFMGDRLSVSSFATCSSKKDEDILFE